MIKLAKFGHSCSNIPNIIICIEFNLDQWISGATYYTILM